MLTRYRRVNVEGARLLVGEWWDARTRSWLPCYPDLIAHPRHTPAGRRVLLCIEDACAQARPARDDGSCVDCGECRHYRQLPGALLGTCGHPSQSAPPAPAAPRRRLPRHPCQPGKDAAARSTTTTKEETP